MSDERIENEFDELEWLMSGRPVPFEVDGAHFALRQPAAIDIDRMRFVQTRANDWAMKEYRSDGMDQEPITEGMANGLQLLLQFYQGELNDAQGENDTDEARRIAREMDETEANWPQNLAEERARAHSRRVVARWIVNNLLEGDARELRRLTGDPLNHDDVIEATQKILRLVNFRPNLNGRQQ